MVRRSLFALSLILVGCGGGGGGRSDDTKDATARLRLFNGSRQANLGLTLNGTDANGLANGVDFGGTTDYRFVADGAYRLGLATNGGAGTTLATQESTTFEPGQTYGAFAYGASGEGLVFARLSGTRTSATNRYVQVVDLLEGERPITMSVSRGGVSLDTIALEEPGSTGFTDLGDGGTAPNTDDFSITLYTDGNATTPLGAPLSFKAPTTRPTTVVLYGSRTSPRIKVLYGIYTSLPAQQG